MNNKHAQYLLWLSVVMAFVLSLLVLFSFRSPVFPGFLLEYQLREAPYGKKGGHFLMAACSMENDRRRFVRPTAFSEASILKNFGVPDFQSKTGPLDTFYYLYDEHGQRDAVVVIIFDENKYEKSVSVLAKQDLMNALAQPAEGIHPYRPE